MQTLDDLLANLNPQQRDAALHDRSPLLIVAGAGTGKTTTLAHRVAALIAQGTSPGRILLLTFTRRAAAEMLRRVGNLLARSHVQYGGRPALARDVWGGTFHATATRLLRQHGHLIGLVPEFSILDRSDAEDLLNSLRSELELAKGESRFPLKGTCLDIYSRCVNTQHKLEQVLKETFPWCLEQQAGLKRLFQAFTERKEAQQLLDYDDLLLFWQVLMTEPAASDVVRAKFDCVLVDEYQDTNALQLDILRGLCPDGAGLTVVGDDAQSVYSFRAATIRNILDFGEHFPGATILPLEQNYRSTQPLLDATNAVIALSQEGHRKTLWSTRTEGPRPVLASCLDESEQTDYVIECILAHRDTGIPLLRQAVLFRAAHHSLALELELSRRNIPFHKYGGMKFIEAAHVKDLLAFLRLAENPRDSVSALRVLLLIPGIGPKKAAQLVSQLQELLSAAKAWQGYQPPAAAAMHWPLFLALLTILSKESSQQLSLPQQLHHIRLFLAPLIEKKYDDAHVRMRDLEQLEQLAGRFESRAQMLSELTLDPPNSTQDFASDPTLDEDWLTLSTIHSAKGLEWDAVFLLHAADGNLPSDIATGSEAEVEEERRLFYVALTRAKEWLYVCHPQRSYFANRSWSDQHSLSQRTRFLPDSLLPLFERVTPRREAAGSDTTSDTALISTAEVRRRIGRMWD